MSTTSREEQELWAEIERLLMAADPLWAVAHSSREEENDEEEQASAPQSTVGQQATASDGNAVVAGANNASSSGGNTGTQPAGTAPATSVPGDPLTALAASQQNVQQARAAMTPAERAARGLRPYDHLDAAGQRVGTLWQTALEHRTYRQSQRRRGAALVRAATTSGRTFPRRRRGGAGRQ